MQHSTHAASAPKTVASLPLTDRYTIGLDLGDKESHCCVLDGQGEVVSRHRVRTRLKGLGNFFRNHRGCRVAYEAGTHSAWVTELLVSLGCETFVANPRKLAAISKNDRKNDLNDAELLARIARVDPKLLRPIQHRSLEARVDQAVQTAREALIRSRTMLINCVRGLVKPLGVRIAGCSAPAFHKQAPAQIPEQLRPATDPLLETIAELTSRIRHYDRLVDELCEKYPETEILRQVAGVGSQTSLAYVLAVEDPSRFEHSRAVGAYFGLVPKQRDSGKQEPQLRISKAGDGHVRRLLVSSAQYILGPFGPDCDLRRFGKALAARGGKNAKKRAAVAVARRLAVLLHRLWVTRGEYEPLRHAERRARSTSA